VLEALRFMMAEHRRRVSSAGFGRWPIAAIRRTCSRESTFRRSCQRCRGHVHGTEEMRALADAIPGKPAGGHRGGGHVCPYEKPAAFNHCGGGSTLPVSYTIDADP
jgi:hypothetical protein